MFSKKFLSTIISVIFLKAFTVNAQPVDYSEKKRFIQKQVDNLTAFEDSAYISRNNFINGILFYPGGDKINNPFFIDNEWRSGKILTSDKYSSVSMVKYDINLDHIVLMYQHDSLSYPIYLTRDFIKEFTISGHSFRYIEDFGAPSHKELKPGYYEVLFAGEVECYLRRTKFVATPGLTQEPVYNEMTMIFLKKDGRYFRITGQRSLFAVLSDHGKEIKFHMRNERIRVSVRNYESIVKVLDYYSKLN